MAWVYHNKPPMGWPLDLSEPINDGLLGYWYMPEGSGNKVGDLSGNGNTGTFGAGATSPAWVSGKFGSAINFDGGDYFSVPEDTTLKWASTDAFTKVIWFERKVDTGALEFLIQQERTHLGIGDGNFGTTDNVIYSNIGGSITETNVVAQIGTPYQVALVYNNTNLKIYVNGIEKVEVTRTLEDQSGDTNYFATQDGTQRFFNGLFEHAITYGRDLAAGEIALLNRFPFYGFLNPDEIPVLDQYYTVGVGAAGIMTTNSGYWGPTF